MKRAARAGERVFRGVEQPCMCYARNSERNGTPQSLAAIGFAAEQASGTSPERSAFCSTPLPRGGTAEQAEQSRRNDER